MASQQVAIVTGTSSGIGLAVSVLLAQNGFKVYATMRNTKKSTELLEAAKKAGVSEENLIVRELDVTTDESVNNSIEQIIKENGRVDVLVNNAGYSKYGTIEQLSIQDGKEQFETNFFGVIRCTKAVLPTMRQQKSGRVLVTSSIGGVNGAPFNDVYCASKFAVEGLVESLAPVYKKFGVHVISIEPGATSSDFISNVQRPQEKIEDLEPLMNSVDQAFSAVFKYAQTSEQVAEVFLKAIQDENPQLRYQTAEPLAQYVKMKGSDNTGNTGMNLSIQRYLNN